MTTPITQPWALRLPPETFYWAVLDASPLPRRAPRRIAQLGYLFEAVLPLPVEHLHAAYLPIDRHRVLACGLATERLAELATPGILTLGPAALPAFLGLDTDAAQINLLEGRFEPIALHRRRRRLAVMTCTAALALAALVLAGQLRRAAALLDHAAAYDAATNSVYASVLPPGAGTLPPAARLTAELRTLDRTRAGPAPEGPGEIAPTLAALLASWPPGLPVTTESLSVGPGAISLTARLPDAPAAERFERELRPPPGWRLAQPDVQADRDGILVRARMEPIP
ncbi:MAG: hypothetical protein IT431_12830 [Phycisphaerales bacterium]|nr:hypothetical protein [Phycisphaerales bacterium]